MSRETVALVVRQFEAVNRREFEAVLDTMHDDVTLVVHGHLVGLGSVDGRDSAVGKQAVGDWFREWFSAFSDDYRFEIDEARDLGDRVLVIATHHGYGRASGVPVTIQSGYLYSVRLAKVSRIELWGDRAAGALEAAGLQE
jgi:ketosteroid isomerase-like protein